MATHKKLNTFSPSEKSPDDPHRHHSFEEYGTNKRDHLRLILLVWMSRLLPIFAAIFAIAYIIYLIVDTSNWITSSDSSDSDILLREKNRGAFVSVVIAILLNIIGAFMFYIRVNEGLVVTNYGFILGPIIGFMLDQAIGTDAGFKEFMTVSGVAYTFSSLIGGNFMRYIITVFLDLFISNPLQDTLKTQAKAIGVIEELVSVENKSTYLYKYDAFVAMNFPSLLQSIVAFVTFNAYTNQTRFAWAYPAETLDRELRIPPGTIMLSTGTAAILYLCFYTIMDYISEREYFDVNTKLLYVLFILALLYGLNSTDSIEAPVEGEIDQEYTKHIEDQKPYLGMLMFAGFVSYGFIYPIWTRLGCCGYCKPNGDDDDDIDHFMMDTETELIPKDIVGIIKQEIFNEIMALKLTKKVDKNTIANDNEDNDNDNGQVNGKKDSKNNDDYVNNNDIKSDDESLSENNAINQWIHDTCDGSELNDMINEMNDVLDLDGRASTTHTIDSEMVTEFFDKPTD